MKKRRTLKVGRYLSPAVLPADAHEFRYREVSHPRGTAIVRTGKRRREGAKLGYKRPGRTSGGKIAKVFEQSNEGSRQRNQFCGDAVAAQSR